MRERAGFSLVEVVVALTLFALLLSSLAVVTVPVVRGSAKGLGSAQRAAIMMRKVNQLQVLPYDALPSRVGCATGAAPLPRTECVRVTDVSATTRRVTVVITPTDPLFRPDSVSFERVRPAAANAFNTQQ